MTSSADRPPRVGPSSVLGLPELVIREEGDDFVVGRQDTGEFVVLPAVGAKALRCFASGMALHETSQVLEREFGEELELGEFVDELIELGFVIEVDQLPVGAVEAGADKPVWLRAHHVAWLFDLRARIGYAVVVLAAIVLVAVRPTLLPTYRDLIFAGSTSVVLVGSTALFLGIVALHEFAHLAAARSLGVLGRISLGTRLYSLVAQTDISGLWALPKRQRMRGYLAGMACDAVVLSVLLLAYGFGLLPGEVGEVLRAAMMLIVVGLAAQCQLFLRTDLYFVLADLLGARNLHHDAVARLAWLGRRMIRRADGHDDPTDALPEPERHRVRWYAWFVLVGTTAAVAVFAVLLLPALVLLFVAAVLNIVHGASGGHWGPMLDGGLTLAIEGGFQVTFLVIFLRSRLAWWRRTRRAG